MANSKINEAERLRGLTAKARQADEARRAKEAEKEAARRQRWESHRSNLEGLLVQRVAEEIVVRLESSARKMKTVATVRPQEIALKCGESLRANVVARDVSLVQSFDGWLTEFVHTARFRNLLNRRLRRDYNLVGEETTGYDPDTREEPAELRFSW